MDIVMPAKENNIRNTSLIIISASVSICLLLLYKKYYYNKDTPAIKTEKPSSKLIFSRSQSQSQSQSESQVQLQHPLPSPIESKDNKEKLVRNLESTIEKLERCSKMGRRDN